MSTITSMHNATNLYLIIKFEQSNLIIKYKFDSVKTIPRFTGCDTLVYTVWCVHYFNRYHYRQYHINVETIDSRL